MLLRVLMDVLRVGLVQQPRNPSVLSSSFEK